MARTSARKFPLSLPFCLQGGVLALLVILVGGCTRREVSDAKQVRPVSATGSGRYEVRFVATRLKDHTPLATAVVLLNVVEKQTVHRRVSRPAEDQPVFSDFSATLTPMRTPGQFQLVTRVAMREAVRTKKGRLKFSQRNEGALLPIRPGETQNASASADPVQIEVQLERR